MGEWTAIFLPSALLLARVSGFFVVMPVFSLPAAPLRVRLGVSLLVTWFFGMVVPSPDMSGLSVAPLGGGVLVARELIFGLGMGIATALAFRAAAVGARFAERLMGFADASSIDPVSGEGGAPVGMFYETAFMLLFLVSGGHRLLLWIVARSLEAFPPAQTPEVGLVTEVILEAGAAMLLFGLKLAAPVLAAFTVLSVILAVLARVLPEMNVLMISFPVRVGAGLFLAGATMPILHDFTVELAEWMSVNLTP